jgi:hypothetical protein
VRLRKKDEGGEWRGFVGAEAQSLTYCWESPRSFYIR